jgi:F1F0 ATPase subunit 2
MMEIYSLVFAFGAGLALGAFFSFNLWASVRKMVDEKTPWYVLFGGYVFRMSMVLVGFFLVMAGRWERMTAALAGFLAMRAVMGSFLGRNPDQVKGAAWRS